MRVQGESVVKLNSLGASISGTGLYTSLSVDLRRSSGTFDLLSFPFQSFPPVTSPPRSRVSHARPFQPVPLSSPFSPLHCPDIRSNIADSSPRPSISPALAQNWWRLVRRVHDAFQASAYYPRRAPSFKLISLGIFAHTYNHWILVFRIRLSVIDMRRRSTASMPAFILSSIAYVSYTAAVDCCLSTDRPTSHRYDRWGWTCACIFSSCFQRACLLLCLRRYRVPSRYN